MPRGIFRLKATHKAVQDYYAAIAGTHQLHIDHELGLRHAFEALLDHCARRFYGWTLAREHPFRVGARTLRPDGAIIDDYHLTRGWYEAKGPGSDLELAARAKLEEGYPRRNILFWQPRRILLYQNGARVHDAATEDPEALVQALQLFFEHREPPIDDWEQAVADFKDRVPDLAASVLKLIRAERRVNSRFRHAFETFYQVCREAINPNLSEQAVEEMLIQHLLTERIFRKVFDNPDFSRRNAIAVEIERVIDALTSQSFSRREFLKSLDPFYAAIESTAAAIGDFSEKQGFLNTVYEQFFQGFSVRVADTHGIVYTPQEIVGFMVESVDELLRREFGKPHGLADQDVHLIDPFVGTGNFVVRVLRRIAESRKSALPEKYRRELWANEVMLLPYYIASMNIEHAYFALSGRYEPFEGVCLVDTFELAEDTQKRLFTAKNTERVERQRQSPIRVVIGNPPYNVGQVNENDNNKNRKYHAIDARVRETYARSSRASSTSKLDDPYIKAIRWATDRIGDEGIVAFVCNNKYLDGRATDGLRKHLAEEFDQIYVLDLGGTVRNNPKISGTTHNVFGIQVGVSINFFVRQRRQATRSATIAYHRLGELWRREERLRYLEDAARLSGVKWQLLVPDERCYNWLTEGIAEEYQSFLPMGKKQMPDGRTGEGVLFHLYCLGVTTARDFWAYNFKREELAENLGRMIDVYNDHVARWPAAKKRGQTTDDFVEADETRISWSRDLKKDLKRGVTCEFANSKIRLAAYRPFTTRWLYYDSVLNEEVRSFQRILPSEEAAGENRLISVGGYGRKPFACLMLSRIPDLNFYADPHQNFSFYTYDEDGSARRENLSDWTLIAFRERYGDTSITKWDIFHYIYAVLHHPAYRARYAANLRKELPRIPFAPVFWEFAAAGARLAQLHVGYENEKEYPLEERWKAGSPLDYTVERMRYDSTDGRIVYNQHLTLLGIPPGVERYRLGHRSALGWVVDQQRIQRDDKHSGIVHDPNRPDDPRAIVRLIGQVVTISIETLRIVDALPNLGLPDGAAEE